MNVLVVANEKSGSSGEEVLERVASALEELGDITVLQPPSVEAFDDDVRRSAQGKDVVVAAGGDGTLHATVNALWDKRDDLRFAVVPMGTGNDFAHTLELPEDPVEAARALTRAPVHGIDVGRATGAKTTRLFVNACMGGFPVEADRAIGEQVKKRLGPFAFWLGGAKAAADLTRYAVSVDGELRENIAAVGIGNGRTAGGGIPIFADADPSDGKLNCCWFEIEKISEGLRAVARLKQGSHVDLPNVHAFSAERIEVGADPTLEFNVDGDLIDFTTPATFELAGRIDFLIPG